MDEFRSTQNPNVLTRYCRQCRDKTNERQRRMKYYKTYRDRKRAEDEDAYLEHQAKIAREWRENNKDHWRKWRTKNMRTRLGAIKQQAALKKIAFRLTDETCERVMRSACFYCGHLDLDTTLNGIDRMNNNDVYAESNCVACCGTCNFMKCALDARTFVERCRHVSAHNGGPGAPCDSWTSYHGLSYGAYKQRAVKKGLEFALTKEEFGAITEGECAYCGRGPSPGHNNGVDRVDNQRGYTVDNCVTCCGDCNYSKRDFSPKTFVEKCRTIAAREHAIPDMPRCLCPLGKRTTAA